MRNLLTFIGLVLFCWPLHAQTESFFYGVNGEPLNRSEQAIEQKEVHQRSENRYVVKTFRRDGEKWEQTLKEKIKVAGNGTLRIRAYQDRLFPDKYNRFMQTIQPGSYDFTETRLEKILREGSSSSFIPLHLEGKVTEYYPNGTLKSRSIYKYNQLVSNENWLPDGTRYIDSIFYSADTEPEYKMGNEFFRKYILQKLAASEIDLSQIEDVVVLGWVVMEDGQVDGVIPLRGRSRSLNQLLAESISELPGEWEPARLDGRPVRYYMSIPLNFIQRDVTFQDLEFSQGVLHYNIY